MILLWNSFFILSIYTIIFHYHNLYSFFQNKHIIKKSDKGPPLPCRCKIMQQIRRNRNQLVTLITSKSNDGAASDTDSGYEYVANPMKNRNRAVGKLIDDQGQLQNENGGNGKCYKSQPNKSNNADRTEASTDPVDCGKMAN